MNSTFKANMERFFRISEKIEALGLEVCGGAVVDNGMPSHQVVCRTEVLVDAENFLEANTVIAQHLEQRESKIQRYLDEQAWIGTGEI